MVGVEGWCWAAGGEGGVEICRLNTPNYSDVKQLHFLAARSFTDGIYMCSFLVLIYMNFIYTRIIRSSGNNYGAIFTQMALLDFQNIHHVNENISSSEYGTQVINFGNVFQHLPQNIPSSLLLSWNINVGLKTTRLYTVVFKYWHMYLTSMGWPCYGIWWNGCRQKIVWTWQKEKKK